MKTKTILKRLMPAIGLLLCVTGIHAQTIGPLTLSSPGTTGVNNSTISVTMGHGFTATAPFSAAIVPLDCATLTTAPTQTSNYIITSVPRTAGYTDWTTLIGLGTCQLMQTVQYVDGLGRPIQTVQVMGSPALLDVVQPQAYDQFGREINKYLPYVAQSGTAGSYRSTAVSSAQQSFYTSPPAGSMVSRIDSAHAHTLFDNSPLNRPIEQGAPGLDWQIVGTGRTGNTVRMDYTSNNSIAYSGSDTSANSRKVALYTTTINSSGVQTLVRSGDYTAGMLTVSITKDENGKNGKRGGTVEEYKDMDGKVVLKRTYNYAGGTVLQQLSTYYVYDDFSRLAFVLPPGANPDAATVPDTTALKNFCYQYQYDGLGRQVQKKLPGKGWEYTVYNTMDQPVATQDAVQRASKEWVYTKYDAQGRVATTGTWINSSTDTRAAVQGTLDGISTNLFETPQTTGTGYSNSAWPASGTTALTYNYYDNYSYAPSKPTQFATAPTGADLATRGQLVATKTAVLNTPADMLWSTHYYDYWGRTLTAYQQHYLGGVVDVSNYNSVSATYDFTNALTTTTRQHWNTTHTDYPIVTVSNRYLYDHMGRKVKTWEQIQNLNNTPTMRTLLSKVDYNEIGQVKTKSLHATTDSTKFLQPINYTYNQRGWLQTSVAPLLQMQLQYNTGTNKQYNGNIAYQLWGVGSYANTYTYTYDNLNRLTGGSATDNNNETGLAYDVMGNITRLQRYQSGTLIDDLTYDYATSTTNQLQSIADAATNAGLMSHTTGYKYDVNGNLQADSNTYNGAQNKSYTYNLLNLPKVVTIPSGTVTYTYDATGKKLRKVNINGATITATDYVDGIQYNNSTSVIDFIQTEEGRAKPDGTSYDYQYYLTDNLGNTRVTFGTKTGTAVAYQRDDYYPFGLEINRTPPTPSVKNEYLYNKKELQEELGQYDYGARLYDPVIARWTAVDPLAEKFYRITPYSYVANNPVIFNDPNGKDITQDIWGNVTFNNNNTPDALNAAYVLQGKKKNIYVDIEGKESVRNRENQLSAKGFYNNWAVFAAENLRLAADALSSIVSPGQLDNLAIESHGGQGYESGIEISDIGSTKNDNFLLNSDIETTIGSRLSNNCADVQAKVLQLKDLSNLVKNNGNLILAVCEIGAGQMGIDFGLNIGKLASNRMNVFLPKDWVNAGVGMGLDDNKKSTFIPWMTNTFDVRGDAGWIKITPQGKVKNINTIKLNIKNTGNPIDIEPH